MTTKKLELVIAVVYTPAEVLEGQTPEFKTYTPREAADEVADYVREQILKTVPRGCICSLVMGKKGSDQEN